MAIVGREEVAEDYLRTSVRNSFSSAEIIKCENLAFPAPGLVFGIPHFSDFLKFRLHRLFPNCPRYLGQIPY